jgi:hypothetical protein
MKVAGCGWLTPVILATLEAEIRRITKPAQANSSGDPILKIPNIKKEWQSGSSGTVPA